jgi:hypothetical protein
VVVAELKPLFFELFSAGSLVDAGEGPIVLDALDRCVPGWSPRSWGFYEPFGQFDRDRLESMWVDDHLMWWGRGADRPLASLVANPQQPLKHLVINGAAAGADADGVARLLTTLAAPLDTVYGFAHLVVDADAKTSAPGTGRVHPELGPLMNVRAPDLIRRGLPNLWWANVFGPPIVDVVGEERIATAPAHTVTQLGEMLWYLQLTESFLDNQSDPDGFNQVRAKVKAHLGADVFWDPDKGESGPYRPPQLYVPAPRPPRPMRGTAPATPTVTPAVTVLADVVDRPEVRALWEAWAEQQTAGVWTIRDLPAESFVALTAALPASQRTEEINDRPTLDRLSLIAQAYPFARLSGTLTGAATPSPELSFDRLWLPAGIDDPDLDLLALSADSDESDGAGRTLWWD